MDENGIYTGKIIDTTLGIEDHGIMTLYLHIEGDGWGCSFGGYALDKWSQGQGKRVGTAEGIECIRRIMDIFGVRKWENVKGNYVRVRFRDRRIKEIGHIIKDDWFCFQDIFGDK